MRIKSIIAAAVALTLGSATLYAHGSHRHEPTTPVEEEASRASIKKIAQKEVRRLTLDKKIDGSWLFRPISKMKKIEVNHKPEWVISFENLEIKDKTKQTLYIFVTLQGKLTGANYTGK